MEREKNLYMYVYRMILTSIYNGTYTHNEKLPVLTDLCETYQVGRNTVRSALQGLQEDGYLTLQKGVQATVLFDVQDLTINKKYRQALLDVRDTTKDVYETMQLILPDLFVECFHCEDLNFEGLKTLINEFTLENVHNEAELIKRMYEIYLYTFKAVHNPILVDLFVTLLSFAYQPLIPEEQSFTNLKRSVNGIRKGASMILKLAQAKQDTIVRNLIRNLTKTHSRRSLQYLDVLCNDLMPQNPVHFIWVCNREQEYLYVKVVFDILVNISDKTYQMEDVLPSISTLSKRYDVSDRTTRKALEILRDYQIIETENGVGSKIIKVDFILDDAILKDKKVQESLYAYSNSLHVFTTLCKSIMPDILKNSKKEELIKIAQDMEQCYSKTLAYLSEYVFQKSNTCLYTIYTEMKKTLIWSVFVNMFVDHQEHFALREKLVQALYERNTTKIFQICMRILQVDITQIESVLKTV